MHRAKKFEISNVFLNKPIIRTVSSAYISGLTPASNLSRNMQSIFYFLSTKWIMVRWYTHNNGRLKPILTKRYSNLNYYAVNTKKNRTWSHVGCYKSASVATVLKLEAALFSEMSNLHKNTRSNIPQDNILQRVNKDTILTHKKPPSLDGNEL